MPFNPTTEQLWEEVQAATSDTDEHVKHYDDILRRYVGRWYRKDMEDQESDPENFSYSFVSNMLPATGLSDPQVSVDSSRVIGHKVVTDAMTDGLNAWIKDVGYSEATESCRMNFLFSRGVLMHYLREDTRFSRGSVTPAVKSIHPRRFFQDSLADESGSDQFRGHWYWQDIDALLADPDLNKEVAGTLENLQGQDSASGESTTWEKGSGASMGRRRLKCYSVWSREKNTIRVICEASTVVELFPERPYYGPNCGPYVLFDAYPVPDQVWPLSPIVAVQDQAQDLNIHARAMGRAAARRRSIGLVEASNPDLGDKLADADDGDILPVKGITGQHVIIEVGGATQTQYQYSEYARNRLDRISGLTATIQGNVGAADTATEAKIADDAMSNRIRYLTQKVLKRSQDSLWIVGWFLYHTEGVIIPVKRMDPLTGQPTEGLFFGGPAPMDNGAQWDDFNIVVKLNTMQSEAVAKNNMLEYFGVFMQIVQMAPQFPYVRWPVIARDLGGVYNLPDKADEWLISEMLGQVSQPPMLPASLALGTKPVPPRGAPGRMYPRTGPPNRRGLEGDQGGNNYDMTGRASGPRPEQVGGNQQPRRLAGFAGGSGAA